MKKNATFFIAIAALVVSNARAQNISTHMGARAAALGNASVTLSDEWSLFNNPGGLSKVRSAHVAFSFDARPALTGANRSAAVFSAPVGVGSMAFGAFRFGDEVYSEQFLSCGYGNQFGNTALGMRVNLIQIRSQGSTTVHAAGLSFGGITQLTPILAIGATITNINRPQLSSLTDERLPVQLAAGISLKATKSFLIVSEIGKDLEYQPTLRFGFEYLPNKKLSCRTGFNLHPSGAFFGWSLQHKRLSVDYAAQYNPELGTSHQGSCSLRIMRKRK